MTDLPATKIDLKAVLSGPARTIAKDDHSEGMSYLESLPRRLVTLYLPLGIIVFILLFPFYWMGLTAIKPDDQLLDLDKFNPFWTWLLMGYFKTIPFELEECALIDGASRWQILIKIVLPLAIPGLISAFIFCFTLCWNEFIYALTFLQSTQNKTVPVAIVNEFVDGDIYRWGSLMAGALAGSLPLVILYAFFVEHYVSAMTGAVKE